MLESHENYCYLLSDLGVGVYPTDYDSVSFTKVSIHKPIDNNNLTAYAYVFESLPSGLRGNTTVYLDLNRNGILEYGELI